MRHLLGIVYKNVVTLTICILLSITLTRADAFGAEVQTSGSCQLNEANKIYSEVSALTYAFMYIFSSPLISG